MMFFELYKIMVEKLLSQVLGGAIAPPGSAPAPG